METSENTNARVEGEAASVRTCGGSVDNSDSLSDASTDVGDEDDVAGDLLEELNDFPEYVVKNTFVHINIMHAEDDVFGEKPTLQRSSSAPGVLESCAFVVGPQVSGDSTQHRGKMTTEEIEAMNQRRLEKRLRQREVRREQRTAERAVRTANHCWRYAWNGEAALVDRTDPAVKHGGASSSTAANSEPPACRPPHYTPPVKRTKKKR